jgi:hypothetical protein
MKQKTTGLSRRYVAALRKHLKAGARASLQPALGLGRRAVVLGLETLELARIHERAVVTLEAASSRDGIQKRAEIFLPRPSSRLWRRTAPRGRAKCNCTG